MMGYLAKPKRSVKTLKLGDKIVYRISGTDRGSVGIRLYESGMYTRSSALAEYNMEISRKYGR